MGKRLPGFGLGLFLWRLNLSLLDLMLTPTTSTLALRKSFSTSEAVGLSLTETEAEAATATATPTLSMATVYDNASLTYGTDTNIRLIELFSGEVWCNGEQYEVNCKFYVLPLASRPKCTAISYMWGQESGTSDIVLDDRTFAVRHNLFDLLLRLPAIKSRLLWVNAICIDRASIHERNHQVGMMGRIYSQAQDVIVWLGCNNENITETSRRLRRFRLEDHDVDDKDNGEHGRLWGDSLYTALGKAAT